MVIRQEAEFKTRASAVAGVLLGLLPMISFALQHMFSVRAGAEANLFKHLIVTYVDWVFVPFNFVACRSIDWSRGLILFASMCMSVLGIAFAHAMWQHQSMDGGHMFDERQALLPAGWVHLGYSIIQMSLVIDFVVARSRPDAMARIGAVLLSMYFIANGISGYLMTHRLAVTDLMMAVGGPLLVFNYSHCVLLFRRASPPEYRASNVEMKES